MTDFLIPLDNLFWNYIFFYLHVIFQILCLKQWNFLNLLLFIFSFVFLLIILFFFLILITYTQQNIIRDVIDNDKNKYIYGLQKFTRFLLRQKYLYRLNDEEYSNILVLLNIYNRKSDLYYKLVKINELTPEVEMITNTKYGKFILESWRVEISINILYIICTITIMFLDFNNMIFSIAHLLLSLLIIYEPIILIINIGFTRLFKKHFRRLLFHIFNTYNSFF